MQMYRRKEGKKKVKIGAHKGLILTLPLILSEVLSQGTHMYVQYKSQLMTKVKVFVY